ncbi:beta strand repeat-containing protein [Parasediminibacterium sp. JCM 36343]|uniref:beta strand repeat-containing protein n=1 Tax=Parasediminibacterium sp. JCM 36343 TaxID=3374279 RepID=UPI00397842C9
MKKFSFRIKSLLPLGCLLACTVIMGSLSAQSTYYWVGGSSGSLAQSYTAGTAPWSATYGGSAITSALMLTNSDTLIFDGGNIGGGSKGNVTVTPTLNTFTLTPTAITTVGTVNTQTMTAVSFASVAGIAVGQYVSGGALLPGTFVGNINTSSNIITFSGFEPGLAVAPFTFTSISIGGIKLTGGITLSIAKPTNSGGAITVQAIELGTALASGSNVAGGILDDGGNEIMVNGNITGAKGSGTHRGRGRLRMVNVAGVNISDGITVGNLYVDGLQRTTLSNVTISNDLILRGLSGSTGNFAVSFANANVGGNIYAGIVGTSNPGNFAGQSNIYNDVFGKLTMIGGSATSGIISGSTSGGGSGYATATSAAFTLPPPVNGGIGATIQLGITSGAINANNNVTILDPGTGYDAGAGTITVAIPGGAGATVTLTIAGTHNKYIAVGQYNLDIYGDLVLADTAAGNSVILGAAKSIGRTLWVRRNLSFSAGNTSGKMIINSDGTTNASQPNSLAIGNNANGGYGSITMASTNKVATAYPGFGRLYFNSTITNANGGGTIYFDTAANQFYAVQYYRGNFTLGSSLKVANSWAFSGGTNGVSNLLAIGAGATLTLPNNITQTATLLYGIDASNATSSVVFAGGAATTVPPAFFNPASVANLNVATAFPVRISNDLTVTGLVGLSAGSSLIAAANNTLTLLGNATGAGIINWANGTVICIGTAAQTINLTAAGNLTINNAAGVTASPAVTGLLTITSGDLSNYSNINASTSVLYNGSAAQTANAGLGSVNNLTINNAAGVTLSSSPTVNGALTLTSGKLFISDKNLKLGSSATVSQASAANNYVAITGAGTVKRTVASGAATLFPIGTKATYNPVTLTPTSATDLYVGIVSGNTPTLTTIGGTLDTAKTLSRTWSITPSIPSATDMTFGYDGVADANSGFDNSGSDVALLHNAGSWEYAQHVLLGSGVGVSKAAVFTGITSFSNFTIANPGTGAVYINGTVAKANDEYRSVKSGLWDDAATWQVLNATTSNWESTVTIPSETNTATIKAGDTVTIGGQAGIGTLTIETGATLKSSANAYTAAPIVFTVGKANAVFNNNGTFGTTIGTATTAGGDGISIVLAPACTSFSLTGTGSTGIGNLYPMAGSNNLVAVLDQSVQFRASSASTKKTVLSLIDPSDVTATGSRTLIVNAGKTVSFIDSNACLHSTLFSPNTGSFNAQQGDIVYDIQGTLHLNGGNIYLSSSSNAASSAQKVKLNIGAAGKIIVAGDYNVNKVQSTQSVYTYIEDGGLLDASGAPLAKANSFGLSRDAVVNTSIDKINSNATITIAAGSGGYYTTAPTVTISGITGGTGATATAVLTGNTVTSIVFSGATGTYTGTPFISIAPSTVGGLAWVVMGGINATYSRLCGSSKETYNIAVPPASGNYAAIKGNPLQINTFLNGQTDVYSVGVATGNTPAPATAFTDVDPKYALNRTWKIIPSRTSNAYGTYLYFGFTGGSEDANSAYSPTFPAVQNVTASYETDNGPTIAIGTTDLFAFRTQSGKWASLSGINTGNSPTAGSFGTTWQMPQQQTSYIQTGYFTSAFVAPYYFTLKNAGAPFICH